MEIQFELIAGQFKPFPGNRTFTRFGFLPLSFFTKTDFGQPGKSIVRFFIKPSMEQQQPLENASPNTLLARQIARQLLEQGLIGADNMAFFVRRLAEGQLREADWRAVLSSLPPKGNAPKGS